MILDYITRQNRRWLAAESARDRQVDMAEVDDPRVDVCIYCLPPHRCARNWLLACCRLLAACACCLCLTLSGCLAAELGGYLVSRNSTQHAGQRLLKNALPPPPLDTNTTTTRHPHDNNNNHDSLRPNDVRYMSQLGRLVPVLPVVMKADTMTISEAQRFRQEVAARLTNPDTRGVRGKINTFGFSPQSLERAGIDAGHPSSSYPFVIIASNDVDQGMLRAEPPMYWPQRAYRWGTAEAFNGEHSDLLALRALLLSEGLEELVAAKRARYEDWRRDALRVPLMRRVRRRAARLALMTLLPAAGVAFAAAHDFDGARMADAVRGAVDDVTGASGSREPALGWRRRRGGARGGGAASDSDGALDDVMMAGAPLPPPGAVELEAGRGGGGGAAPRKRFGLF